MVVILGPWLTQTRTLRWRRVTVPAAGSCSAMRPAGTFGSSRPLVDGQGETRILPCRGFGDGVIAQIRNGHFADPATRRASP